MKIQFSLVVTCELITLYATFHNLKNTLIQIDLNLFFLLLYKELLHKQL
jgi:hypothetical protein